MNQTHPLRFGSFVIACFVICLTVANAAQAQPQPAPQIDVNQKLAGFDAFMEKTLKDWNAPGIGVGIVVGDKLVFAKGYGYRDYEKKLPLTSQTMFTIASNTKLFTAMAGGRWVEKGKLPGINQSKNRFLLSSSTTAISITRLPCVTCWRIGPASRGMIRSGTSRTTRPKNFSSG